MSDESSDSDIDFPLGHDLESLLAEEKARGPESEALRDRVYRRVVHGIGASGDGGGSGPSNEGVPKRKFPVRASAAIGAVLGAVVVFSWPSSQSRPAPIAISRVDDRAPVTVVAAQSEEPRVQGERAPSEVPSLGVDALPSVTASPSPRSSAVATAKPACAICEEQRLLVEARAALGRRDFDKALESLTEHQRRYPSGQLAQEREAVRVRTLSGAGRDDEARASLAAFETAFPSSPFLPSLRGVVAR